MPHPRRSGAHRRAQLERSQARVIGSLLKAFSALQHRGCCHTRLGTALAQALLCPAASPATAPLRPPGIFDAAPATTAYAQPAYAAPSYVAPPTTAYAQPAYAAPTYAAPPSTAFVQQPIIDSKGIIPVPLRATRVDDDDYIQDVIPVLLRATRQPSVKAELFQVFKDEIDVCVVKGGQPHTHYEQQRQVQAFHAMEILNLCVAHAKANG